MCTCSPCLSVCVPSISQMLTFWSDAHGTYFLTVKILCDQMIYCYRFSSWYFSNIILFSSTISCYLWQYNLFFQLLDEVNIAGKTFLEVLVQLNVQFSLLRFPLHCFWRPKIWQVTHSRPLRIVFTVMFKCQIPIV